MLANNSRPKIVIMKNLPIGILAGSLLAWSSLVIVAQNNTARLSISVSEESNATPIPFRIHLKGGDGKPIRPPQFPFFRDHFVCDGTAELELPPGDYHYEIERGPEYWRDSGTIKLSSERHERLEVRLKRLADMSEEGWWPGDLHVHRPVGDIAILMKAEDLHVAPVITWWNNRNLWADQPLPANPIVRFDGNRVYQVMGGEDEREGGALMYFNLNAPLAIEGADREFPSPMKFLTEARRYEGAWIDIEKPFWWDVPVWLASGEADSIGLANNHMCRTQMYESEAWGKPRDTGRFPPPRGNGFWTQEIYYQILNCGLRIPPSAGSASGVLPNPVGYNRVYVYLGKEMDYTQWWKGLRAGRSFVTNGPMLRCKANDELPGHVFTTSNDGGVEIDLQVSLSTRDPIASIEIIKNGLTVRSISTEELNGGKGLGRLAFSESGWFLVRAVANNSETFRFASTAPFYVEIGTRKRRISRSSAQFFLDWVRERRARIQLGDTQQRSEVVEYHNSAEAFWIDLAGKSNAD